MLSNEYNQEILKTLSEIFVDLLPRLSTARTQLHTWTTCRPVAASSGASATSTSRRTSLAWPPERALVPDANGTLAHRERPASPRLRDDRSRGRAPGLVPLAEYRVDVPSLPLLRQPDPTHRLRDLVTAGQLEENFDATRP